MNPLLIRIGVIALALAVAFGAGHRMADRSWQIKEAAAQKAAADAFAKKVAENNQLADALEKEKANKQVIYETITRNVDKVVERPIYRNVCIDDRGLQLINEALAGKSDSSQPAAAVPGTDAARR